MPSNGKFTSDTAELFLAVGPWLWEHFILEETYYTPAGAYAV